MFPFTYGDVVYSSCAEVSLYGGVGWCSHKAVADDEDWAIARKPSARSSKRTLVDRGQWANDERATSILVRLLDESHCERREEKRA